MGTKEAKSILHSVLVMQSPKNSIVKKILINRSLPFVHAALITKSKPAIIDNKKLISVRDVTLRPIWKGNKAVNIAQSMAVKLLKTRCMSAYSVGMVKVPKRRLKIRVEISGSLTTMLKRPVKYT